MSSYQVTTISNRLSLRPPQRQSVELLNRICELVTLGKEQGLTEQLETVKAEFKQVTDFDREFPSLCFSLATGVGKTRLMGAFISYLHIVEGIQHFFVLAPNLTIYQKLIADFTPNTPKYVFKGIGEFAQNPPLIVTGENYESGLGVRGHDFFGKGIHINIFNISKITARDKGKYATGDERRSVPRFRRLREEMGESYFDYLAGLDDLVVLMDESHRYRASAGMDAINELKPVLGLELTATPQVEKGKKSQRFNNVILEYPLSSAMADGFVKEPAVATRENFDVSNYTPEGLEQVKLKDGIRIHENTKIELEIYARDFNKPIVKPFMLVVAQDTEHANRLQDYIESKDFFENRYKGKVITVHSNTSGEEKDDVVEKLLNVENPENPVEVVIHVNMLKEGWDVTNLYTIVPLRAANSRTLVEQSIGRGLRLPYGKRVGVPAVDRLTIVSHDKFQDIVDYANDPNSIIRVGVVIGQDIPEEGKKAVIVPSRFDTLVKGETVTTKSADQQLTIADLPKPAPVFQNETQQKIAKATAEVIQRFEHKESSKALLEKSVQKEIVQEVNEAIAPFQSELDIASEKEDVAAIVQKTTELYQEQTIDIPKVIVVPSGEVSAGYADFDLNTSSINLQPVSHDILVQHLHDQNRHKLESGSGVADEKRLEDYIVRGLSEYDDISYESHARLLYKLAGQAVEHLKSYLKDEDEIKNVLQYHQQLIVKAVHSQMQKHYEETATSYNVHVSKGFRTLRTNNYSANSTEEMRDYKTSIPDGMKHKIRTMVFKGFEKCLYQVQKFDSDTERRFGVILENDDLVLKWFKPARGDVVIEYEKGQNYEPDFIVETQNGKYLCEPKRADEMNTDKVVSKAVAATEWCKNASVYAESNADKPWAYLLIPHEQISEQITFDSLIQKHTYQNEPA